MAKKPVKPPAPRNQKIKRMAIGLFAVNFIIIGFFTFGSNLTCGHTVDLTSQLQVAWREANCPETLHDPENADMEYQDMVSKQKDEEAEKPANISP